MRKLFTCFAMLMFFSYAMAATYRVPIKSFQTQIVDTVIQSEQLYGLSVNIQSADKRYEFRFFINEITEMAIGQTYTLAIMYSDYSYGTDHKTHAGINYSEVSLVRNVDDYAATITTTNGDTYVLFVQTYLTPEECIDTVDITMFDINYNGRLVDLTATKEMFQFYGYSDDDLYYTSVAFGADHLEGSHDADSVRLDDTGVIDFQKDTTYVPYLNSIGSANVTNYNGIYTLTMAFVGYDSVCYNLHIEYHEPVATNQYTLTSTNLAVDTSLLNEYSIFTVSCSDVQYKFQAVLKANQAKWTGTFTEGDVYSGTIGIYDVQTSELVKEIYTTSFTIASDTCLSLAGNALCYGDINFVINATGSLPSSIQNVEVSQYNVYTEGKTIVLNGAEGELAAIYDVTGRAISNGKVTSDNARFEVAASGLYLVRVNGETLRVVVK